MGNHRHRHRRNRLEAQEENADRGPSEGVVLRAFKLFGSVGPPSPFGSLKWAMTCFVCTVLLTVVLCWGVFSSVLVSASLTAFCRNTGPRTFVCDTIGLCASPEFCSLLTDYQDAFTHFFEFRQHAQAQGMTLSLGTMGITKTLRDIGRTIRHGDLSQGARECSQDLMQVASKGENIGLKVSNFNAEFLRIFSDSVPTFLQHVQGHVDLLRGELRFSDSLIIADRPELGESMLDVERSLVKLIDELEKLEIDLSEVLDNVEVFESLVTVAISSSRRFHALVTSELPILREQPVMSGTLSALLNGGLAVVAGGVALGALPFGGPVVAVGTAAVTTVAGYFGKQAVYEHRKSTLMAEGKLLYWANEQLPDVRGYLQSLREEIVGAKVNLVGMREGIHVATMRFSGISVINGKPFINSLLLKRFSNEIERARDHCETFSRELISASISYKSMRSFSESGSEDQVLEPSSQKRMRERAIDSR